MTGWDFGILGLAVLCALVLLFFPRGKDGQVCLISWEDGEVVLPLDEPDTFTLQSHGISLTVAVKNGGVRVTESGCPDGVCLHTGEIRYGGEIIVCVPADVVIRIPSDRETTGGDFTVG